MSEDTRDLKVKLSFAIVELKKISKKHHFFS